MPSPIPCSTRGLTAVAGDLYDLHVLRGVIGLDVGVNGLFHHALVQLSTCQLAPHCRVIAPLCELVCSVQVVHVVYQHLHNTTNGFGHKNEMARKWSEIPKIPTEIILNARSLHIFTLKKNHLISYCLLKILKPSGLNVIFHKYYSTYCPTSEYLLHRSISLNGDI